MRQRQTLEVVAAPRAAARRPPVRVDHGPTSRAVLEHFVGRRDASGENAVGAASHQTAAALLGMRDSVVELPVHITSEPHRQRIRRPGAVIHHRCRLLPDSVTEVDGIAVTSAARMWVDMALSMSTEEAVVLADTVLRPPRREFGETGDALATQEQLLEAAGWLEVRITNRHSIRGWHPAVVKVGRALESRGWRA